MDNSMLVELLNVLFQRDNKVIDDIIEKFDYKEEDYIRPPENYNVAELINTDCPETNCEFSHGHIHTEETESNGLKLSEGTVELWFKFNDVKIKRKKIFRLGDYYIRILNMGFDKWDFLFYTKMPKVDEGQLITEFALATHPHISHGRACLAAMETGIRASITNYNFNGFLWRIRTFLSSWNFRSPHHYPERFEFLDTKVFNEEGRKVMFDKTDYHSFRIYYLDMFQCKSQYGDKFEHRRLMLPSARKKVYDSEPLSRVLYNIQNGIKYLTGEAVSRHRFHNNDSIIVSIADWINTRMDSSCTYTDNDYLVLAGYLCTTLYDKSKRSISDVDGTWDRDKYNAWLNDWYDAKETWYHHRHRILEKSKYHKGHEHHLWYLTRESDNPVSFAKCGLLMDELNNMRTESETLRERVIDDNYSPSGRDIRNILFNELTGIFKDLGEITFASDSEFIDFANNYYIDSAESVDVSKTMETFYTRFLEIKDILDKEYNKLVIEYHETELRRLTDGKSRKNTVQIETLNL